MDTDAAIAEGLKAGDPDAIELLWDEYGGTVFGFLVKTTGDRGEAEDVHQQVFAEAWQRRREYDPGRAGLLTWLLMMARSRAIDAARRRRPEPRDPATIESDSPEPDEPQERMLEQWRVAHLLQRIPAGEAEMLRLRFYEGLSQTEIATRLEVPLGTVKMRMVNALERLRELIEEEEGVR